MRWVLLLLLAVPLLAETPPPVPASSTMERFDIEEFITGLKRGTPVQMTLDKGKVIKGVYRSYDDYYETIWIVPQGEPGIFSQKGYKISGVRKIELWDRKPTVPNASATFQDMAEDGYQLLDEKK
jgi:hypothetical protein